MRFGHRFESRYFRSQISTTSLITAWPLNEASGTRYPDYGGSEFDLTDVDTVGTADAPIGIGGLCVSLNGSTEYLYCADPFPPPFGLSVFAWVYPTSLTSTRIIASQDGNAAGTRAWNFYLSAGVVGCLMSANGSAVTSVDDVTGALSANTWYLVGFTWDGSTISVYKNLTVGATGAFASAIFDSAQEVKIGAWRPTPTGFFAGRIAQTLIWGRAITADEISYLYNGGNGRPLTDWL